MTALAQAHAPQLVNGYDAAFWYESYRLVSEAVLTNLDDCIHEDDVAEEAIFIEAIETAGRRIQEAEASLRQVIHARDALQQERDTLKLENEQLLKAYALWQESTLYLSEDRDEKKHRLRKVEADLADLKVARDALQAELNALKASGGDPQPSAKGGTS